MELKGVPSFFCQQLIFYSLNEKFSLLQTQLFLALPPARAMAHTSSTAQAPERGLFL
jgi:hypothetical protein